MNKYSKTTTAAHTDLVMIVLMNHVAAQHKKNHSKKESRKLCVRAYKQQQIQITNGYITLIRVKIRKNHNRDGCRFSGFRQSTRCLLKHTSSMSA
jgi:hypothetical protein